MHDGRELTATRHGLPLGLEEAPDYAEGSMRYAEPTGVLLYTDGLTEARRGREQFGQDGVTALLSELHNPTASEAVALLSARVAEFSGDTLTDDLCMLAAHID
jgi:serine phosphatase RsbU (regulator of sigma subunit)